MRHDADAVQSVVLAQLQADGRLKLEIIPGHTGAEATGLAEAPQFLRWMKRRCNPRFLEGNNIATAYLRNGSNVR